LTKKTSLFYFSISFSTLSRRQCYIYPSG